MGADREGVQLRDRRRERIARRPLPGRSQLLVGFNGSVVHLANHDVTLGAVSRAPFAKLHAFKQRMGWSFPWASSFGGEFNFDFKVSVTEEQQRANTTTSAADTRWTRSRKPPRRGPLKAPP